MYLPRLSDLPSALVCNNGALVRTKEEWEATRRKEIIDLLLDSVYGRIPCSSFKISHTKTRGETESSVYYKILITTESAAGSHRFQAYASAPKTRRPVPFFELIQFPYQDTKMIEDILFCSGYGFARFFYPEVCTDDNNDFSSGIHSVIRSSDGKRKPNDWGAVASWAWAASRLMDILQTLPEFDTAHSALVGHSRTGKAAILAGALDERFRLICANETGCGGSAITRGKQGEHIRDICAGFPCWFCDNYKSFGEDEESMPFDQHMLLDLIAPRPLYITSASEDLWSGPESEFLAASYVSEVYALYGKKGPALPGYPVPGTVDQSGDVAYHLRPGKHELADFDWRNFVRFADRVFGC